MSEFDLGFVLDKAEVVVQNVPADSSAGYQLFYLCFAAMNVLGVILECLVDPVGAAFNFFRPSSTNIVDGGEGFFVSVRPEVSVQVGGGYDLKTAGSIPRGHPKSVGS